jgi:hypothetical protein
MSTSAERDAKSTDTLALQRLIARYGEAAKQVGALHERLQTARLSGKTEQVWEHIRKAEEAVAQLAGEIITALDATAGDEEVRLLRVVAEQVRKAQAEMKHHGGCYLPKSPEMAFWAIPHRRGVALSKALAKLWAFQASKQ